MTCSDSQSVEVFRLSEYAEALSTRASGIRMREKLQARIADVAPETRVIIEIPDDRVMTPSFVDEFFGRLVSQVGLENFKRRFVINTSDKDTQMFINKVVRNRLMLDGKPIGA